MAVKKLILLFVFALTFGFVKAQCTFTANANVTINNPTSCNACDGSIVVNSITGGLSPYTYDWSTSNGNFSNTAATGLCNVGNKLLIVRDNNFCVDSIYYNFTTPTTLLTVNTTPNFFCGASVNGTASIVVNGGSAPYTYTVGSQTTSIASFSGLSSGPHSLQVIDANNCLTSQNFSITDLSPASTLNISTTSSPTSHTCGLPCNGIISASASGAAAPYSFVWNNNYGLISTNQTVTGLCEDSYFVTVTDANGCKDSTNLYVSSSGITSTTVFSTIINTTPNTDCIAPNGSASYSVTSGGQSPYSYSLNGYAFTTNTTITGLAPGNYDLFIKDVNGCDGYSSFTINVAPPAALISIATTTTPTSYNCSAGGNGSATAIASGGVAPYQYFWHKYYGSVFSTNQTVTGINSGTFRVIVSDSNGCKDSVSVYVNSVATYTTFISATYTTTASSACGSNSNGIVNIGVSGGQSPYSYLLNGSVLSPSPTITGLASGNHDVKITDANGCYTLEQFQIIDISPALLITLTATSTNNLLCNSVCSGTLTGLASGGVSPYNYLWNNNVPSATIIGLCSGNQTLTVTDANNCKKTKTFSVNNSSVILSNTITQSNVSCGATNDGAITITSINGGTPPYSYSWNNGPYISNNSISFLSSGYYYLRIKDANNCYSLYNESIYIYGPSCGNLNGYVYHDANNNCVHDFGENPIPWISLVANNSSNQNSYGYTYNSGFYSINAPTFGSYTVSIVTPNNFSPFITTYCTSSFVANVTSLTTNISNNFLIQTNSNCGLRLNNNSGFATPGLDSDINFSINNFGFVGASGQLTYTLPEGLSYVSATPTPLSINGNTLIFYYNNINVRTNFQDYFSINMIAATTLTIGSTIYATYAYDVNCTDVYNYSNPGLFPIFVTGPYDPNHKMVWPSQNGYEGDILLTDTELTYKVEFQNIGTAPAVNVVVIDTLSPLLDETSIRQLTTSHPNNFVYNSLSRQMQWRFNNINLPDENSNPTGSIGYFTYKVKQKPTNVVGDVIKNTAHIYFDFNSAIVTNTTKSTIVEPESVNEYKQNAKKNTLFVYPNPSTGIFSLVFNANSLEKGKLIITDIAGKIVVQQDVESKNGNKVLQINSTDFSSGAYFVSIQFQEKELHQKVIIQK